MARTKQTARRAPAGPVGQIIPIKGNKPVVPSGKKYSNLQRMAVPIHTTPASREQHTKGNTADDDDDDDEEEEDSDEEDTDEEDEAMPSKFTPEELAAFAEQDRLKQLEYAKLRAQEKPVPVEVYEIIDDDDDEDEVVQPAFDPVNMAKINPNAGNAFYGDPEATLKVAQVENTYMAIVNQAVGDGGDGGDEEENSIIDLPWID